MLFPLLALLPRGAFAVSLTGSQQNSLNFYGTIIAIRYSGQNAHFAVAQQLVHQFAATCQPDR